MKLTKKELSWAMYDWGNSAYSIVITTVIFPIYFKYIVESTSVSSSLSTALWGYANSFGTLILAILAPALGSLAEYHGYKKKLFEKFVLLGVLFTSLLAVIPSSYWVLLLAFYVLTQIGFAGANIFYDSFLVDVTENQRMDRVSAIGFALGYIGSTIPFMISMVFVIGSQKGFLPITFETASKMSFVLTAIWWLVFSFPIWKNVHQVHGIPRESRVLVRSFQRIFKTMRSIRDHKLVFTFLAAYFFYIDGVDTIIKMSTAYGTDLGLGSVDLLIILLVTQFVAFPFALLYGKLAERFGCRPMLMVGIVVYMIICIYAFFIKSILDFWVIAMLVGTSQGGIQALSRSFFGKIVPKDKVNEFFGFYNIFGKFAAIMGPLLMGITTQITGNSRYGVFSIIALFIIGGVLFLRIPKDAENMTIHEEKA